MPLSDEPVSGVLEGVDRDGAYNPPSWRLAVGGMELEFLLAGRRTATDPQESSLSQLGKAGSARLDDDEVSCDLLAGLSNDLDHRRDHLTSQIGGKANKNDAACQGTSSIG